MLMFWLIVSAVLLALMLWSFWASGYIWQGRRRRALCLGIAAYDIVGIVNMLVFGGGGMKSLAPKEVLFIFLALMMVQVLFNVLVTLAVLWRSLCRLVMKPPFDAGRRRLLAKSALYPVAAFGGAAYGSLWERTHTVVREIKVKVPKLTARDGMRIAQLSDVHLGPFCSLEDWRALLEQAAGLKADMLVITGDLFDDQEQNAEASVLLDGFAERFPLGIYFAFGNHEHYRGFAKIQHLLSKTRVHVLLNEGEMVKGEGLYMVGVDYPLDRPHFEEQRKAYHAKALANAPTGVTTILLAHHPECIDDGAESGVALTLTGHTHGAQFGIFGEPIFPIFRYTRGLVRQGDCYGYVHSGNGSWFPCRIGCPPEIAVFTLVDRDES